MTLAYLCSKCGRPHSLTEFRESRFCRNCGKLLTYGDRTLLEQGTQSAASALEKTYKIVRSSILHSELLDSVEVVKQVERHRQFWRPKIVNVVLLAESHVYTDEQECRVRCRTSILDDIFLPENRDYPTNFVKLVYCLGYGENWLLERAIDDNSGTWQFWKIFGSCVAEDKGDLGFDKILKTKTRNNHQRLSNKVDVLRKMKAKGIWLLDASIVGIYKSGLSDYPAEYDTILRLCWDNYIAPAIEESQPKFIAVIGKKVERALAYRLRRLDIPSDTIYAPQAQLSRQEQRRNYEKYQEICSGDQLAS